MPTYSDTLARYDALASAAGLERKGKSMPYTSANGHMFSLLNKDGELGVRIGDKAAAPFMEQHNTTTFHSHGARMRGYVKVTDTMLADDGFMVDLLKQGLAHVQSLPPK